MRTQSLLLQAMCALPGPAPQHIVELGCGDGRILLGLANRLHKRWPAVQLTLVDRQSLVKEQTLQAFADLGWHVDVVTEEVMNWARRSDTPIYDLVLCNLFIHHFAQQELIILLEALSRRTRRFFACEPRRARLPLLGSHLVALLGANAVTRSDAVLSVHAGFRDNELSLAWPQAPSPPSWHLKEYSAGLFSHCFLASRQAQ